MTYYKDFNFKSILDRPDLVYCPYVATLDIQYAHNIPYLWTFYFDSTNETIYGRTFEDLICFLEDMKVKMKFSNGKNKHYLVIIVEDLFTFFGNTKKVLPYVSEPFVAKSGSDILLATLMDVYQIHSYKAYFETDLKDDMEHEHGIALPEIQTDLLSAAVELSQEEIDNSENRVIYMASIFRQELDLKYQGIVNQLPLTKTSRVKHLFYLEERKMSNRAACNLGAMIMKLNPITSEHGREYVLPLLFKAFFGGCVWYEQGIPDKAFDDVMSVDASSAYVARMVLNKYPMGKFIDLPQPESYKDLFDKPYNRYAMLITFEAQGVELKPDGLPVLPSALRNHYVDTSSKEQLEAQIERSSNVRVYKNSYLHMTLTDVDFKLFLENYNIKRIKINHLLGSLYGYLPDYVMKVIIRLYASKADAKQKKNELEKLGVLTLATELEYNRIKSELARLYGIFTKRPVMERYIFDTEKKEPKVIDHEYIQPTAKFSPVLYQWGVWTTALVRKEISDLRRRLLAASKDRKVKVLSGDTDNINYTGDAIDIISNYNDIVKSQIEKRAEALGISPELLKDLGSLTIKKYKKYKLTGLKQYCYIRESESGDIFEYKVGGMNADCQYFNKEFKTPLQRFNHFSLGLTIPAEYDPRVCMIPVNSDLHEVWTDREGNRCEGDVLSYVKRTQCKFTLYPASEPSAMGNSIKPGEKITVAELNYFARKISSPVYNPKYYIENKNKGVKK